MFEILSICKGGGYKYCRTNPLYPGSNSMGLYPLHRVIMANKLGRPLLPSEIVHHIDENKENNDESNLEILTNEEHGRLHRKKPEITTLTCHICNKSFTIVTREFKRRIKNSKSGVLTCSRNCGYKLLEKPILKNKSRKIKHTALETLILRTKSATNVTEEMARRIKYGGESSRILMNELKVSIYTIGRIRRGESWKYI